MFSFLKILKILVLFLLTASILLIVLNLVTYSEKKGLKKGSDLDIPGEVVNRKEKIVHFEVRKGQKENFFMKADQHYLGEDNRYHLEGNVEVVFLRKTEGDDLSILTSKIIYDKALKNFWSPGETKIESHEATLISSGIKYSSTDEIIQSLQKVEVISENMNISATGFRFYLREARIEFLDNVRIHMPSVLKENINLEVMADKGEYKRDGKFGTFSGNVLFHHGESQAQAQKLEFRFTAKENLVRWMKLSGDVRAVLENELEGDSNFYEEGSGKIPLALYNQRQEIEAGTVIITSFVLTKSLRSVELSEGCRVLFQSSEGETTEIKAGRVSFFLNQDGGLKSFSAKGSAVLNQTGKSPQDFRLLEGDSFSIGNNKKILTIESLEGKQVRLASSIAEISADMIALFYQTGDYQAEGKVRGIFKKQISGKVSTGLFDITRSLYVTCGSMRSFAEEERYLFEDNVKMWQEERFFSADRVIFNSGTGNIKGEKNVAAVLSVTKESGEKDKIEISSQEMIYEPEERILVFRKEALIKYNETELKGPSFLFDFDEEKGEFAELRAYEGVSIRYRSVEGKGKEAHFFLQDEILILAGKTELIHETRGRTEGDKLTFYLAGGRIILENSEKERSAIIIK